MAAPTDPYKIIIQLKAKIAELEYKAYRLTLENDALKEAQRSIKPRIPLEWKLTPLEATLFSCLLGKPAVTTKKTIMAAMYGDRVNVPMPKIIDIIVHQLRKKLPPEVKVRTVYGQGFVLDPVSKARYSDAGERRKESPEDLFGQDRGLPVLAGANGLRGQDS